MTIQELKNLKVGDVVKRSKGVFWEITKATDWGIELVDLKGIVGRTIYFDSANIDQVASELEIAQLPIVPDTDRQLRLIEAKIKDAEFDVKMWHDLLCALSTTEDLEALELTKDKENILMGKLISLREQRNKLIEHI